MTVTRDEEDSPGDWLRQGGACPRWCDRVGNRLTSLEISGTWSSNANNELLGYTTTAAVQVEYEYDANGNTVKETRGSQVTEYVYNSRNRLERVLLPDGRVATYAYDPFGRRVKKTVANLTTLFVYADEGLVGEYDTAGMMEKIYGWKPGGLWGTDPLYMVEGGDTYFYHNDHLGTPQRLTDASSGAVVWGAGYQAFGLAVIDPTSIVENNLRFPGQYWDAETGGHYNYFRNYDVTRGAYFEIDPFRQHSFGSLYTYALNNPLSVFDNYGLAKKFSAGISGTGFLGWLFGIAPVGGVSLGLGGSVTVSDDGCYFQLVLEGQASVMGGTGLS